MSDGVATLQEQTWDADVIQGAGFVLVYFWAEWCAPCKMLAPTVEALAEEFRGTLQVGKLDIEGSPKAAERYDIRGVPTLILFEGGQPKARVVGVTSREELTEWISSVIGSSS